MKKYLVAFLVGLFCTVSSAYAQIGGQGIYQFLQLPTSARVAALGGHHIAVMDDDSNLANQNPSLYNPTMTKQIALNTSFYLADINYGYVAYTQQIDSLLTMGVGVQYANYGDFVQTDEFGQITGSFTGGEYAFSIGGAYQRGNFSYGITTKFISSALETYQSTGIVGDIGITYNKPAEQLALTVVARNIGYQFTAYHQTKEKIKPEVQIGLSKRLAHLPFRFSILMQHVETWDLRYELPTQDTNPIFETNTSATNTAIFFDNLFRHFVFNGELFLGKALVLRGGYNHLRRKELINNNSRSLAGFSFGVGLHIKRLDLSYGRTTWHQVGGTNHLSLRINLANQATAL